MIQPRNSKLGDLVGCYGDQIKIEHKQKDLFFMALKMYMIEKIIRSQLGFNWDYTSTKSNSKLL